MLRVDDVSFSYDRHRAGAAPVLDRVSFAVERGAVAGLLGPNGSGKTTLLRIVDGMLKPDAGRVTIDGDDVARLPRRALARRIAVVPQETRSAFDFTALDIVLMGRYAHLGPLQLEGAEDLRIAREAMAATGTLALEARPFDTLSGGEKQRVIIAGALAQASDVLLLDEPTASLDLGYQLDIAALLVTLNRQRGTTMILSTHDLNLAAAICSSLVLLRGGRVIAAGPTADVLTADAVRQLYGVEADVRPHPRAGHLTVVPIARPR
ncbi:MAG: ABC transporter ATP-binding protein [Betaproteobacteria bacterium]